MISVRVRNAVIFIVALVWAINFVAPVFVRDYKPAPELNVAFMAIVGALTQVKTKEQEPPTKVPKSSKGRGKLDEVEDEGS